MNNKYHDIYGKLLLFGEYSILLGGMALSVPLRKFSGRLSFDNKNSTIAKNSNSGLLRFAKYLQKKFIEENLEPFIYIDDLIDDLNNGLHFPSTIPSGYGVGSSGALCAAIYKSYGKIVSHDNEIPLEELKKHFAFMESYFHGKSSGFDPLICYLNEALLIDENGTISVVYEIGAIKCGSVNIFLIDTGNKGHTGKYVNEFMTGLENPDIMLKMKDEYLAFSNASIKSFLEDDPDSLKANLVKLSEFQLSNLSYMIPQKLHSVWQKGLNSEKFYIKICGSGGGGYMILFSELPSTLLASELNNIRLLQIS